MELFTIISVLTVLCAAFSYINHKFMKLPNTIGLMILAIGFSLLLILSATLFDGLFDYFHSLMEVIDFPKLLLEVMLSFLLFAGALHINLDELKAQSWSITTFATFGVIFSTFLVAGFIYLLLFLTPYEVPFIACLLFGALISPTDPIAVLGILKKAGLPQRIQTIVSGESLFNDGVGVVVFLTVLEISQLGLDKITALDIAELFVTEVAGGIATGLIFGWIAYRLMRSIDQYHTEIFLTLAVVLGGYSFAAFMHFSAPLAMVAAGLLIGNSAKVRAMSAVTKDYLMKFWEIIDEYLNALLFVLIGLEIIILPIQPFYLLFGIAAIILVLAARWTTLGLPSFALGNKLPFDSKTISLLTWSGLRGGISIALALGIPEEYNRELFITMTYTVVAFSIIVQGLTLEPVIKRLGIPTGESQTDPH